jgi:prepilin signal peptidase PulO-like enzyme (type II secretory pathway)
MELLNLEYYYILAFGVIGLMFGSFISLVSYRLPLEEDIIVTRSRCTSCKHSLSVRDLIPLFSWLVNKGKCRFCKAKVKARYPIIEISTAVTFILTYLKFGLSYQTLLLCLIATCLIIVIVIDFEHYIIPDEMQICLSILGIIYAFLTKSELAPLFINSILLFVLSILIRLLVMRWKKKDPLGMGDIKFFAVSGLFLNLETIPYFLLISGVLGVLTGTAWKTFGRGEIFPFAPALAISLFLCLLLI